MGEKVGFGGLGFLVVVCFGVCFLVFLFCFNENSFFFLCKTLLQDIVYTGCTLFADSLRSQYESLNCEAELFAHQCLSGPE